VAAPQLQALLNIRKDQEAKLLKAANSLDMLLGMPSATSVYDRACEQKARREEELEARAQRLKEEEVAPTAKLAGKSHRDGNGRSSTSNPRQMSVAEYRRHYSASSGSRNQGSSRSRSSVPRSRSSSELPGCKSMAKSSSSDQSSGGRFEKLKSYLSHAMMWSKTGHELVLEQREEVEKMLKDLHHNVAQPLCQHFNLRYDFLLEQHCQERKAGVTRKEPHSLRAETVFGSLRGEERRYLVTVRIRLRVHPARGDPQKEFISRGSQMAVLLHELAHLRHMNHGPDFMLFLSQLFKEARRRELFDPETMKNELQSSWPCENAIYKAAGDLEPDALRELHDSSSVNRSRSAVELSRSQASKVSPSAARNTQRRPWSIGKFRPETALLRSKSASGRCRQGCPGRAELPTHSPMDLPGPTELDLPPKLVSSGSLSTASTEGATDSRDSDSEPSPRNDGTETGTERDPEHSELEKVCEGGIEKGAEKVENDTGIGAGNSGERDESHSGRVTEDNTEQEHTDSGNRSGQHETSSCTPEQDKGGTEHSTALEKTSSEHESKTDPALPLRLELDELLAAQAPESLEDDKQKDPLTFADDDELLAALVLKARLANPLA